MIKKLLFSLLICTTAWAQNTGNIKGVIKQSNGEVISFANVFLYQLPDSSFYKATFSEDDGMFRFEEVNFNLYFIKITSLGFKELTGSSFRLESSQNDFDLGDIILQTSDQILKEVNISARRPLIEQKKDRIVINVENSIFGAGNNALEVLGKAPGVTIDRQSNQIKLKNKSGVLVLIDGRPTHLSTENLSQMLSSMTAEQIQSIDIITTPSSKYEAAGSSGIIDIRLKKNKNYGTNGILSLGGGYAFVPQAPTDLWRGNFNLNLNNKTEKWNLFGNLAQGKDNWFYDGQIKRSIGATHYEQYYLNHFHNPSASLRLGADYILSPKTTIGAFGDFNFTTNNLTTTGDSKISNPAKTIEITPLANSKSKAKNYLANFNLSHQIDTSGKSVTFDFNIIQFDKTSLSNYEYQYHFSPVDSIFTQINRIDQPTDILILTSQLDFTVPIQKVTLEFGAKSGRVVSENNFVFEDFIHNNWIKNNANSNVFNYSEWVNALYFNSSFGYQNWAFQAGLRLEHTLSDGNSITTGERNKRSYFNLFPSLMASHDLNENNSIHLAYSRRIDRPDYASLNPFTSYVDPLTFNRGNPFLNPQFANTLELNYSIQQTYNVSLSYSETKNIMVDIIEQDDATGNGYQTMRNIANNKVWSTGFSGMFQTAKWWNLNSNLSLYYNHYKDQNIAGSTFNIGKIGYNMLLLNNFSLQKGWAAEASFFYNSPILVGILDVFVPRYSFSTGIQKTFLNNNARLKLNVSDIFLTTFNKIRIDFANMNIETKNRVSSRRANLTFTYNFGNKNVKMTQKTTSADELKGRIEKQ